MENETSSSPSGNQNSTSFSSNQLFSNMEKLKDLIEIFSKLSIGIIAAFYATGILVVSIHLNKYGAYSLNFFRVNYISAGLWTLIPILLPLLIGILFILFIREFRKRMRKESYLSPWTVSLPFILTLSAIGYFIYKATRSMEIDLLQREWMNTLIMGIMISVYLFALLLVFVLRYGQKYPELSRLGALVLLTVCLFILHASIFAYNVFDKIPSFLGGGKLQSVELIVGAEDEIIELLNDSGISFHDNSVQANVSREASQEIQPSQADKKTNKRTKNVALISVTEEEYILKGTKGAVVIPRDLVKAVLYQDVRK